MTVVSVIAAALCVINISENRIMVNAIEWFVIGANCSMIEVLTQVSITIMFT